MHLTSQISTLDWELLAVDTHLGCLNSDTAGRRSGPLHSLMQAEALLCWSKHLAIPMAWPLTSSCDWGGTKHKTSLWTQPGTRAPQHTLQRAIPMTCNCHGLMLTPTRDKGDFPQNSSGSRIKPQDHIIPAAVIMKYCVAVINTASRRESHGQTSLNQIHLNQV